jgi:hypothetical protein
VRKLERSPTAENRLLIISCAPRNGLMTRQDLRRGFDCFAENAVCNLGVADWHGRGVIRQNLRDFIDKGFTPHHDIGELWDGPLLKVFHGKVKMTFDDLGMATVRSTMTHFYMDQADPSK